MTDYRIDCVNKPDRNSPHERITHVGGPNPAGGRWKDTVANIVAFIESKEHRFYTSEDGSSAWVGVRTSTAGNKFLQTYADGVCGAVPPAPRKLQLMILVLTTALTRPYHGLRCTPRTA
jgi:hypothetical protein